MKRVSLDKLLLLKYDLTYEEQYEYIIKLMEQGKYRPVLASGTNGKKPALYREYWRIEEKRDYRVFEEELQYQMSPLISVDYYLANLKRYEEEREWVVLLNDYLKHHQKKLDDPESFNERSFEIWQQEKFLAKGQGKKILKHCGLSVDDLNVYETTEPLAYYSHTRKTPQNLLILENKDTFYSMRRHLMAGNDQILGTSIGTLIYGAGKGIFKSFQDFDLCAEPYMKAWGNRIYYFGDLDYEGIGIYEKLTETFGGRFPIDPFLPAYEAMLGKVESEKINLPNTKDGQMKRDCQLFFSYFKKEQIEQMQKILNAGTYIPQESLNISDL